MEHGLRQSRLVRGPWSGQDRGQTRARAIGGLKPLESCLGPGADSPSDDGATRLLRATCAQALVAIKATQKQMGLDRSAGGPERSWRYSLSPRRFLRLTPARWAHRNPDLRDMRVVETAARCGCARDAYTANPACDTPDGITLSWNGREGCGVLVTGYL